MKRVMRKLVHELRKDRAKMSDLFEKIQEQPKFEKVQEVPKRTYNKQRARSSKYQFYINHVLTMRPGEIIKIGVDQIMGMQPKQFSGSFHSTLSQQGYHGMFKIATREDGIYVTRTV